MAPISRKTTRAAHALCTCETHKCRHTAQYDEDDVEMEKSRVPSLPQIVPKSKLDQLSRIPINRSKSWDRLDDSPQKNSAFVTCEGKVIGVPTSKSLPSLSNPFPRRVPAALLAAINDRLGSDIHPEDTIVVEMSAENVGPKMRHAFTVQEIREIVSKFEEQAGRKVKPIPLETVLDPEEDEEGPITFEIRHGKEKNVFRLPAGKLKDNKKWFLHYCLWPVGRYVLSMGQDSSFPTDGIQWEEIRLSNKAVLMLPPNFWT
ncbi:uncharacterized protein LOC129229822 [Uloborus diversus]|uniref:uncharacterized protein LOC129229822 n=1 Tax=Uloborus diversus TaxID=327109 RepID=UPI002409E5E8|nr:uncharacterized protein LOC129229822 [Uloborus diversus]